MIIRNVYNPPDHLVDEIAIWLERLDAAYASAEAFDASRRAEEPEPSPEEMDAAEDWERAARERRS